MARKINKNLLERLKKGDLLELFNYIKSDNDLRFEVRREGKACIYYRKGKALEIGLRSFSADKKYVKNTDFSMPDTKLAKENPVEYFKLIKEIIDNWVDNIKKRPEFDTQQNIAKNNQEIEDKYIILDMEYNFPQSEIAKTDRIKQAGFDLLGLERKTGKVVFFEVKKGLERLKGKAGIHSHIKDFEKYLFGKHKVFFRGVLENDIRNIISDKVALGLIADYGLPPDFQINDDVEFIFVFEPVNKDDKRNYESIYDEETSCLPKTHKTIFVAENNHKLK